MFFRASRSSLQLSLKPITCIAKVHTDFLFVGFSRLCNKRLGEKSVRGSGVKQGIRGEEVREGREEGGNPPRCFCARVAHCTCKLTASRFDRSLPSERRRGGRRRSGRRFSVKKKKERCHLVAGI